MIRPYIDAMNRTSHATIPTQEPVMDTTFERAARARNGRQMTKVFKALSDGTRQEILRLLERHQCTVGEIVGNFSLSQPTISRHLSVLKEANLVSDQRQGQNVIYRLNEDALAGSMREFFGQFRSCQQSLR
jgi:ArsR family transcriptional regulator, repressor of sdpIR and other operons